MLTTLALAHADQLLALHLLLRSDRVLGFDLKTSHEDRLPVTLVPRLLLLLLLSDLV